MLIAETEYRHRVETDIRPFHDVLLGLFFITIGMKLDWHVLIAHWWLVILLTSLPVVAKFVLIAGLAKLFQAPPNRCAPASSWPRRANSASCCSRWAPSSS